MKYHGKSMWPRIRNNQIAAMLALAALLLLVPAYLLPFMSVTGLGREETYSIIKSIGALFRDGHRLLAAVIFIFSFIFPIAKLIGILATITTFWNISPSARKTLKKIVTYTGKYSMLDVMVAAVLIVAIKISDMAELRLLPGTSLFCISILLSMLAGQLMDFKHLETDRGTEADSRAKPPVSRETEHRIPRWMWLVSAFGAAVLAVGVILSTMPVNEKIDRVKLLKKRELMPSLWPSLDKPDYFLKIRLKDGWEIQTLSFENTPIGNGLIWNVEPVTLREIVEITVLDRNFIKDEALDRMNIGGKENIGMYYEVHLEGPKPVARTVGLVLAVCGAVILISIALLVLRRFAI